ncbi:rab escort protein 1 [Coffea arabica]|uniref:Rab escort protein 1-like n=1 Tax=Coffea arabica TaxID=13443 RepID=A0A6P6T9X9_COFAR|nr:rab escort protein 1-like [Coffea arabica]XP_027074996.1 rab escort protein 1-like [Coffea arabica]
MLLTRIVLVVKGCLWLVYLQTRISSYNPDSRPQDAKDKVLGGVCITASSLKPDIANCLLLYPPQALFPERLTSIRVLHLSSYTNVCPSGMFVVYVSTICEDAAQGKELLTTAINDLFSVPVSGNSEEDSEDHQSAIQ